MLCDTNFFKYSKKKCCEIDARVMCVVFGYTHIIQGKTHLNVNIYFFFYVNVIYCMSL